MPLSLRRYWKKFRSLPPRELARRARAKLEEKAAARIGRWNGYRKPTYLAGYPKPETAALGRIFAAAPSRANIGPEALALARALSKKFSNHRFNLLGSGWTSAALPAGTENAVNPANRAEAARIAALLGKSYQRIDWQLDFKSGHRWRSDLWHADQEYGSESGVDVKVPWELARMQHLMQFAWAFLGAENRDEADACREEFRHQILDFISANPPGFGVNWVCTMDAGIRVANWILARDLFLALGAEFDSGFESVFARSVWEHGRHIVTNLEWSPGLRGNHYYADIAGLAVAAAALPAAPESDAWLAFAVSELIGETELQFLPDGGNFEASTVYHRLSAEMACYATAVVLSLPGGRLAAALASPRKHARYLPRFYKRAPLPLHAYPGWEPLPFPPVYFERLERAAEFALDITLPDGRVPQIGDNDSGRFLKAFPLCPEGPEGEEDFLDLRHLVSALNGFFGRGDFDLGAGSARQESRLVEALLRGRKFPSHRSHPTPTRAPDGLPAGEPRKLVSYPDFGLYVMRKADLRVAFRCGPIGQRDHGGHAHNDQLSFTLALGEATFLEDPGTHLYTPDWDSRNQFRSTAAHNTLALPGREQNRWENTRPGLFALISESRAEMLEAGTSRLSGRHFGFGAPHTRTLELSEGRLQGTDVCEIVGPKALAFHFSPAVSASLSTGAASVEARRDGLAIRLWSDSGIWSLVRGFSSPAYGIRREAWIARLDLAGETRVKWYIEGSR